MSGELNSFLFSTPEMTRVFSALEQLRAMMRFEWALARALETHRLGKPGSSEVVESLLDASFVDVERLTREARNVGNVAIPFVKQLTSAVQARDERAAWAIHLGSTSQDVLDTALVLQMRAGLDLLRAAFAKLDAALEMQVRTHRNTLMMGRTWLQPGPPITLGLKLAGTLAAVRRHCERIATMAQRVLVLQFGGAVGTLSALGDASGVISSEMARLLGLHEPELPWHTQRDGLAEMVQVLANLTGSLAKFARDIALLMQPEVGEISEGDEENRGGSSTMPNKRNPVMCAGVIAAHARMPGLVSTMLSAMPQEHERGIGLWQAEWDTIPEAFRITAAALECAIEVAERLKVDQVRMRSKFRFTAGDEHGRGSKHCSDSQDRKAGGARAFKPRDENCSEGETASEARAEGNSRGNGVTRGRGARTGDGAGPLSRQRASIHRESFGRAGCLKPRMPVFDSITN